MKRRVFTGAIIVAVALPIIIFSEYVIYPIALSLFCLAAIHELLKVAEVTNQYSICIPSYIIALGLPFCAFFAPDAHREKYIYILAATVILFMLYLFALMIFRKGFLPYKKVAEIYMIVSYVVISFTALSLLRYIEHGRFVFFLVFIAAWGCDTFAYLVGTLIGKHKLIPEISPKKTVEGAIGGTIATMLLFALYGFLVGEFWGDGTQPRYGLLIAYGFVLAIVGQIGDLIASAIKREHGIKDYGNILPGHGGIMDRFDSILAVSTVLIMLAEMHSPFV